MQQDDSSTVCTITGVVLENYKLFDQNATTKAYQNTLVHENVHTSVRVSRRVDCEDKTSVYVQITEKMLTYLLYSNEALIARESERDRLRTKVSVVFNTYVNSQRRLMKPCCILDAIEACFIQV